MITSLKAASAGTHQKTLYDRDIANRPIESLDGLLEQLHETIAPLWPLKDFVAVNPLVGFAGKTLLETESVLKAVCDVDLLPPLDYFRQRFQEGLLSLDDARWAYDEVNRDNPGLLGELPLEKVLDWLGSEDEVPATSFRQVWTLAEVSDLRNGGERSNQIINDITRCLAPYFDEGEAIWSMPWRDQGLFAAWKQASSISYRMDLLGMRGFRKFVQQLPGDAKQAISELLERMGLAQESRFSLLLCQLTSIPGWASYARKQDRDTSSEQSHLTDLLAIRLAYDAFLLESDECDIESCFQVKDAVDQREALHEPLSLTRYVLQVACESRFRRELTSGLCSNDESSANAKRSLAQMVFCIDVRSEPIRRQLETVSKQIETFGFAGFFGMPLRTDGDAHCPALIEPAFQVRWNPTKSNDHPTSEHTRWNRLWSSFRSNPVSSLAFVETLGWLSAGKLFTDSIGWVKSRFQKQAHGSEPALFADGTAGHQHKEEIPLEAQVNYCLGFLKNLGLTQGFARMVVVCGHASEVQNNLFRSGLDCGACGGHSGEPNARLACWLLNNSEIREKLKVHGISIPDDTWFVPAVHNTTTESIVLPEIDDVPESIREDFAVLAAICLTASERCVKLRPERYDSPAQEDLSAKSRDWGDVRPEWGLAGNAAFVIAPRSRTRSLDLGGRVFLHSYDAQSDQSGQVLEAIMTAPMIVTSWINLQYYASTVDDTRYGSGDKLIHNAVGKFGVLEGNGGDLRAGLPRQSVHNGITWQHQPLRLLVVIDAPRDRIERIIHAHSNVQNLVSHGWVTLVALDQNQSYRWSRKGDWEVWEQGSSQVFATANVSE